MKLRVKAMLDGHPNDGPDGVAFLLWLQEQKIPYRCTDNGTVYVVSDSREPEDEVPLDWWVVRFFGGRVGVVEPTFIQANYEVFDDNGDPFVVETPARDEF